jgi:hypothetical protein
VDRPLWDIRRRRLDAEKPTFGKNCWGTVVVTSGKSLANVDQLKRQPRASLESLSFQPIRWHICAYCRRSHFLITRHILTITPPAGYTSTIGSGHLNSSAISATAVLVAATVAHSDPVGTPTPRLTVVAAQVLDVRSGHYVRDAAVYIEGEQIAVIAHAPADASVIDLHNATVLPAPRAHP